MAVKQGNLNRSGAEVSYESIAPLPPLMLGDLGEVCLVIAFMFARADHTERRTGQLCGMSKVCDHRSPYIRAPLIEIRLKIKCDKKIPCQSCQVCLLRKSMF